MKILGDRSLSAWLGAVLTFCWICMCILCVGWVVFPLLAQGEMYFGFPAEIRHGLVDERVGPGGTWTLQTTEVLATTPPGRPWIGIVVGLPFLALITFVLGRLRAIFLSLRDGSPFVPANARRLRSVGLAILLFEALRVLMTQVVIGPALEKLRPVVQGGEAIKVEASPHWTVVFLGLVVLVLAEVFRRGTQIQDEQRLTV